MNYIETSLFKTGSIKIAEHDSPFWYTSGTIGPYFINTHYLYGSEKDANDLLEYINKNKDNFMQFIPEITNRVISFYKANSLFKRIIDDFYKEILKIKNFDNCEYISGGERRDWFFSPIIAYLSKKKLLYIYKNLDVYYNNKKITDLKNAYVCHICDLVTKASSHKRAWIPAIKNINGKIIINASIVDRDEGGSVFLTDNNIHSYSSVKINKDFLLDLQKNNIINQKQLNQILNFKEDPISFGKTFFLKNKKYLKKSLNDDSLNKKVNRFINDNPYSLNIKEIIK